MTNDKSPGYVETEVEAAKKTLEICGNCGHGVSIHEWEDESTSCCMYGSKLFPGVGEGQPCMCPGYKRLSHPGGEVGDACGECGLPLQAHPGRLCDKFVSNAAVVKGECMWNPPSECPACNPKPEAAPALEERYGGPEGEHVQFKRLTEAVPAEAIQLTEEPLCVICDSPVCYRSANGKYYCLQDKPSWQEEEIEVSSEPKPESPQAEEEQADPYADALEEIERSVLPYKVKIDTQGCKTCGHNAQWCVVNAEGVALGRTWADRDEAQWMAEMLKMAHDEGVAAQSQPSSLAGSAEEEWNKVRESLIAETDRDIFMAGWNAARQQSKPVAGSGDEAAHHFEQGWRKGFEEGRKQSQPVIEPQVSDDWLEANKNAYASKSLWKHHANLYEALLELQQFRKAQKERGK